MPRDRFVHDHLPPSDQWPEMDFSGVPELSYPQRLNCVVELLDRAAEGAWRNRPALWFGDARWSYGELKDRVDRIAAVLNDDLGLIAGNRVLLRAPNNPMLVACWLAVAKVGGVAVATMPLLRAHELSHIIANARIAHGLCDAALGLEIARARETAPELKNVLYFTALGEGDASLDRAIAGRAPRQAAYDTAADDPVLIAYTSGTTGKAKGTVHFHRDMLAICDTFARHVIRIDPTDIFVGTPPLAFTFGLGALVLFPLRFGASSVLVEKFAPTTLLETLQRYRCTGVYTAPTGYRAMLAKLGDYDISRLRLCVSAGEHLPRPTWEAWHAATGIGIVDGIGSTEMLHIFISSAGADIRPGSTGRPVPGYQARIVDETGAPVAPGTQGWLAVKGPTGCRYLANPERQAAYARGGWNITGDIYRMDEDGYFWYVARGDDMIVSSGYNISGPEVEACLLDHPNVAECAVIGVSDSERGQIVKAYVVLKPGAAPGPATVEALQIHVKNAIAPYKYPREVEFRESLPKTPTGKLQRFQLREEAENRSRNKESGGKGRA